MNLLLFLFTLALGLAISFLTYHYFESIQPKVSKKIVIYGVSDAGKTALWSNLSDPSSKIPQTVTSQDVNIASMKTEAGSDYELVDVPGHPKLFYHFEKLVGVASSGTVGVVFVIDASSLSQAATNVAKVLYKVLLTTEKEKVPVLIAVNKSDVFAAISAEKCRQLLQAEIQQLRTSQKESLVQVDEEDADEPEWLGDTRDFEFSHLDAEVDFVSGSVAKGVTDKWLEWINDLI